MNNIFLTIVYKKHNFDKLSNQHQNSDRSFTLQKNIIICSICYKTSIAIL